MSERHLHQDMTEAERRLSNVVMLGQVAELDAKKARVRVQAGPILTAWLPFATVRAGPDRTWHAPEPGEQVVLIAPGGDLNQAVVVGSPLPRRLSAAGRQCRHQSHTVARRRCDGV